MLKNKLKHLVMLTGILLGVLLVSGCEQKTINEILADPGRYANREVAVVGTVTQSASVLGTGGYEIEDGTGKLLVVSRTGVPRKGAKIVVKGTIRDGYDLSLFKLPGILGSGLVMVESSHKAK